MKQGLFLFFSFCVISNAYAADDCLQRPTCEELGYTQTAEECVGKSILPCPFNLADSNLVFCGNTEDDCPVMSGCLEYDSACTCTACGDGFTLSEGICVDPCVEKCKTAYPLFAGQANTKAAIDQIGTQALAAYAANQFYVGDKNGDFGQGNWYLPSIGEWMDFYGTDTSQMTSGYGASGATGENKTLINNALKTLAGKGVDAEALGTGDYLYYWSSSEYDTINSWNLYGGSGFRHNFIKNIDIYLRCSQLLKNIFNPLSFSAGAPAGGAAQAAPKVGDVMYSDKTWGSAADYDGSKKAVGIIAAVSGDGRDATIINLKDLTFSSTYTVGNFDPENPYGGSTKTTRWNFERTDITGIPNISSDQLLELAKASDNCPCQFYPPE